MANKKRIATSVAAVATAAALLLGGTFAWQSVNQTALNEASDVINPGGRLHDDFNGSNKDVYVENFTDPANGGEDIFARIRLEEYFEITMNKGAGDPIEKTEILVGGEDTDSEGNTVKTYDVFTAYETLEDGVVKAAVDDDGTAYWSWTTGGETVYMPTFNKDKDSLDADINGTYEGTTTGDDVHYDDYEEILDEKTADVVYDADADNLPDGEKVYVEETHYSANTLNATLISMTEWVNDYNSEPGEYWVYDTDGWVYWAQAIEPGTATGLLLDGIELNQVMDDSWYYAINVVAQFVTADDLGKTDGTGFYDVEKGTAPSDAALELLEAIGVDVSGEEDESGDDWDDEGGEYVPFNIVNNSANIWDDTIYMSANDFAIDGSGEGLQLMTYEGDSSMNGIIANVAWSIEELDENSYSASENEGDDYDTSVFTVRSVKSTNEITEGETFTFRVTASDSQYPDHPFSTDFTVIIGEASVEEGGVSIKANDGFEVYDYDGEVSGISYSATREIGDENAFYLDGADLNGASYEVYSGDVQWDEWDNGTMIWNESPCADISVDEYGVLTLNTTASKYYKIVVKYDDENEDTVSIAFYKGYFEVDGIGEDNLDVNVEDVDISITLPEAAAEWLSKDDAFTVLVHIWDKDDAATGVTVSEPSIEDSTYSWTITFGETAQRNVAYEIDITPPAAIADYYNTYNEQFVVGIENW